jgi:Terminase large subunit, T4likevirus-type, N-terminal
MALAKRLPKATARTSNEVVLHPGQSKVFRDLFIDKVCRYSVVVASRGWGKSVLAAACAVKAIEELVAMPRGTPNRNVSLIASSYSQATEIYYPLLAYTFNVLDFATKSSKANGTFYFGEEVLLKIVSAEAVERMRGTGQYAVVCDELASWELPGSTQQEAFESVLLPCIETRWPHTGRAIIISTPKGMDYLYDLYQFEHTDPEWKSYQFDYTQSPYLTPEVIEKRRAILDPLKFAREFLASFEESGAKVFYCFDRKTHVDAELPDFHAGEDVHACIDFNVGIMACSIFALRGRQLHFLHELKGARDTKELADRLVAMFPGKRIFAYPDPTGRSRKSSANVGQTDFSILEANKIITLARRKNPPLIDSVNCVNAKLKNARGQVEMYFHPRCALTIRSLERTVWAERNADSAMIDKSSGDEHFSDGIRYATEFIFPIYSGTSRVITNGRVLI